jgi:hypothetical protein
MSKQMRFPLSEVTKLQADLERLPDAPPRELSRREAIVRLRPQIEALQSKGYTLVAIAAVLTEKGFPITEEALKKGLAKPARGKKSLRRRGRKEARETSHGATGDSTPNAAPTAAEPARGTGPAPSPNLPKPSESAASPATKSGPIPRPAAAEPSSGATGATTIGPARPAAPPSGWTGSVAVGGSVPTGSGGANSAPAGGSAGPAPGKGRA